jgi:hypothetical protein
MWTAGVRLFGKGLRAGGKTRENMGPNRHTDVPLIDKRDVNAASVLITSEGEDCAVYSSLGKRWLVFLIENNEGDIQCVSSAFACRLVVCFRPAREYLPRSYFNPLLQYLSPSCLAGSGTGARSSSPLGGLSSTRFRSSWRLGPSSWFGAVSRPG